VTHPLFVVLPASVDDPAAPSGGNRYDREVLRRLTAASPENPSPVRSTPAAERKRRAPAPSSTDGPWPTRFDVRERLVAGEWPRPGEPGRRALAEALGAAPDGSLVLLDGLVACGVPDLLEPHAARLRLVILVHLPLSDESGLTPVDAAELRELESRALRLATAVVATSAPAARRVEELHGLSGVHAVPPGVDPAPLAEPSPTGGRLLNVASLTRRKGQDLLLTALSGLPDLGWSCTVAGAGRVPTVDLPPPWTLHLGAGPDLPNGWRSDRYGARTGPRSVRFTGALGGAALDGAYANADLFVLPSRAETYGMVVTEALARGLPVVAADVGGVPEALGTAPDGGVPGRLIPPDDPEALATALRDWLTDPGLRDRWRSRARARRQTLTGWDETARRLAEVLDALT
jgi:glycosyltransferase involved in cell wall biosynthesis